MDRNNEVIGNDIPRLYLTRLDFPQSDEVEIKVGDVALGAWCFPQFKLHRLNDYSNELVGQYVQGDSNEMDSANLAVANAFELLMPMLAKSLNDYHSSDWSERFWKITVGYWFRQYLDVLYERYQVILAAQKTGSRFHSSVTPTDEYWVANDTDGFSVGLFSDRLNHQLFSQIGQKQGCFETFDFVNLDNADDSAQGRKKSSKTLRKVVFNISSFLVRFNRIILVRSYFQKGLIFKLSLRFASVPLLGTPSIDCAGIPVNRARRNKLTLDVPSGATNFEQLAGDLVAQNIPKVFVEGYSDLMKMSQRLLPKRAKLFVTANAFAAQEVYKVWAGLGVEQGHASHVILQHGANYGHSKVMSEEEFETTSTDYYLSTGWRDSARPSIKSIAASAFLGGIAGYEKNSPNSIDAGQILWVLCSLPRYQYTQWSAAQGPGFINYLDDQCGFVNALAETSRSKLKCRPYHYDYGWGDLYYFKDKCGAFPIDTELKPLRQGISAAKVVVFTYESTSMMESMAMNIPTVCYWNPEKWAWRSEAQGLLKQLKDAGIYHESGPSAAVHLNALMQSGELMKWWCSEKVQAARLAYCAQYAATDDNAYKKWVWFFKDLLGWKDGLPA